jgi:hypothetical protein
VTLRVELHRNSERCYLLFTPVRLGRLLGTNGCAMGKGLLCAQLCALLKVGENRFTELRIANGSVTNIPQSVYLKGVVFGKRASYPEIAVNSEVSR